MTAKRKKILLREFQTKKRSGREDGEACKKVKQKKIFKTNKRFFQ